MAYRASLKLTDPVPVVAPPPADAFQALSFDASGALLWAWVAPDGSLVVEDFQTRHTLPPHHAKFRFPLVQRFTDGRWLVVETRSRRGNAAHEQNAAIYTDKLERQTAFAVGDAVHGVVIDKADQIWVGYFDENPVGLKRFSNAGAVEYDYNQSSGQNIFDLYAMAMDQNGDLWLYPYTDFPLVRLAADRAQVILNPAPVEGAHAIAVGGTHVAFFGSYDTDIVTLFDLRSRTRKTIELTLPDNKPGRAIVATQGDHIALLRDGQLFQFHLSDLIAAAT